MKPHYQRHVFFCTNQSKDGSQSCAHFPSTEARNYAKQRCQELGIHGPAQVRVSFAGCLGRCSLGPVAVVYPEAIWYTYVDNEDIEDIVQSHLLNGEVVERLLLPEEVT